MQTGYTIGRGEPRDLRHLPAIEREAGRLFEAWNIPQQALEYTTTLEEFQQAHASGRLWIAFSPCRQPVGFALVEILAGQPHLEEIDVAPSHGRRGLGRALIDEVCSWARQAGYTAITLTTFRDVPWNEPYYARLGFCGIDPDGLTDALRACVDDEASHGLDPNRRVVMKRDL